MKDLLRKLLAPGSPRSPLRPPGAVAEGEFAARCIQCGKCAQVCPYQSIELASVSWGNKYGTPLIFPRETPCYLCMQCPPVCPSGALDNSVTEMTQARMGVARIDRDLCLAYNGVLCKACFERCPLFRQAITLENEVRPVVHEDICVGCGVCENVCPPENAAISVSSSHDV